MRLSLMETFPKLHVVSFPQRRVPAHICDSSHSTANKFLRSVSVPPIIPNLYNSCQQDLVIVYMSLEKLFLISFKRKCSDHTSNLLLIGFVDLSLWIIKDFSISWTFRSRLSFLFFHIWVDNAQLCNQLKDLNRILIGELWRLLLSSLAFERFLFENILSLLNYFIYNMCSMSQLIAGMFLLYSFRQMERQVIT